MNSHTRDEFCSTVAAEYEHQGVKYWLEKFPAHQSDLDDVSTKPVLRASHFHDWIMWLRTEAVMQLTLLDIEERKCREIGLQYHSILFRLRRAPTRPDRTPIEKVIMARLKVIFENSTPRKQQAFFMPWYSAVQKVHLILKASQNSHHILDMAVLEEIYEEGLKQLDRVCNAISDVQRSIRGVRNMVDQIQSALLARNDRFVQADLTQKFSTEGRIFYIWVATFPEVGKARSQDRASLVTLIARAMLADGVDEGTWWIGNETVAGVLE